MAGFSHEGGITHVRREARLLVDPAEAAAVAARLARELALAPAVPTAVTTVYFDGPGLPLARRALVSPTDSIRVRVKEYLPSRAPPGSVVLDVKRERGAMTTKDRRWISRSKVRSAVAGEGQRGLPPVPELQLAPVAVAAYERRVYQRGDSWRVTVDHGLSFHRASWDLLGEDAPPLRSLLGAPEASVETVVLEVKYLGTDLPEWVGALVLRAQPYSKFVDAMSRLHVVGAAGARGG
jgi:hypothetical protein